MGTQMNHADIPKSTRCANPSCGIVAAEIVCHVCKTPRPFLAALEAKRDDWREFEDQQQYREQAAEESERAWPRREP